MNNIGPTQHPDRPRVVVFGGGKGGTGRSTMCAEIARSLARQGQRVLCIDASWSCPTLNVFLNAPEPPSLDEPQIPLFGEDDAHIADFIFETGLKNIWLASLSPARRYPFVRPRFQADALIANAHELDFDWVLIDLAPGLDPFGVGLFTLSDIPMLVCSPEPAAVRMATQFLRSVIFQALGYHPHSAALREDLLDLLYDQPLMLNRRSLLSMAQGHPELTRVIEETLRDLEVYLIVNLVREGAERDLGFVLSHAWYKEFGVFPRFLTPVDYEDRRWFYNRRTAGLTSTRGDEALSNDIEQLVRHLTQIELIDQRFPRPIPEDEDAPAALILGMSADTSPNLVRQHCRRLWEGYRREATVALAFSDPERRAAMAERIELLYKRSLTLPGEHQAPEPSSLHASHHEATSTPPPTQPLTREHLREAHPSAPPSASAPPRDEAPTPPPATIMPERSPGRLVERLRQQHGISLQELSQRSHIGLKYLAAIEDADLEILPRSVYLRGYLREIARIFGVDPDHLVNEYFRMLDAARPPE